MPTLMGGEVETEHMPVESALDPLARDGKQRGGIHRSPLPQGSPALLPGKFALDESTTAEDSRVFVGEGELLWRSLSLTAARFYLVFFSSTFFCTSTASAFTVLATFSESF